jgi:hypothetical protein
LTHAALEGPEGSTLVEASPRLLKRLPNEVADKQGCTALRTAA